LIRNLELTCTDHRVQFLLRKQEVNTGIEFSGNVWRVYILLAPFYMISEY